MIEVELGEKRTSRYKSSWADLTSYAMENVRIAVLLLSREKYAVERLTTRRTKRTEEFIQDFDMLLLSTSNNVLMDFIYPGGIKDYLIRTKEMLI